MATVLIVMIIVGTVFTVGSVYWRMTQDFPETHHEYVVALIFLLGATLLIIGILGLTDPPGTHNENSKASPVCLVWADDEGSQSRSLQIDRPTN